METGAEKEGPKERIFGLSRGHIEIGKDFEFTENVAQGTI
jgi:hypothetical protein